MFSDGFIVELPNRSDSPEDSYEVRGPDLERGLADRPEYLARTDLMLWHTHPSGGVGPSKRDMEVRVPGLRYLVVTLPGGEAAQF